MIYKQHFDIKATRKIKPFLKLQNGFSLIEVLIAAIVLAVGLIGVGLFQTTILKNSTLNKQRVAALNFAKENIENLQYLFANSQHKLNPQSGSLKKQEQTIEFTLNWTSTPSDVQTTTQLNIKVTWPDFTNNGQITQNTTLYLSSIVASNTPSYALTQTKWAPTPTDVLPILKFK